MTHERAGLPAQDSDLVDIAKLITLYYAEQPDPEDIDQRVAFGTSGHRGTSLKTSFNEFHILATTQAIVEYRTMQGTDGPLFLAKDTHGLSEPAWVSALEVLAANDVEVRIDSRDGYTPTPALSHAILAYNRGRTDGLADGIVVTPSHNPPTDGGFKYNPPDGGPASSEATGWIQDRANEIIANGMSSVRRIPLTHRPGPGQHRHLRLPRRLRPRPAQRAQPRRRARRRAEARRRPDGRGGGGLLRLHRRDARPGPHRGEPEGRPDVAVHDPGLGRQDPDGLLLAVRDGLPGGAQGLTTGWRSATTPTPTGTASSPRGRA